MFVFGAFGIMLLVSWQRWTSMIVDLGRETDLPLRIMNGEVLYRDIHYLYPPFAPYFNAFLYRIFGVHLDTLSGAGIIAAALLTLICYRIARRLMPSAGASITVCFVVVLCFFKPAGNVILSYSFAGLYGALFSLASVLFLLRFAELGKRLDLTTAGILIGLAVISKQEFGFAAAVAGSAYVVYRHRSELAGCVTDLIVVAGTALLIALPVFGAMFWHIDHRILIEDCHLFYTNLPASLVTYNRFRSGTDDILGSLIQMAGAAAICTAFISTVVFFSDIKGLLRNRSVAVFFLAASATAAIMFAYAGSWDGSPFRALPFMLAAFIVFAWSRPRMVDEKTEKHHPIVNNAFIFIIAIYALAVMFRVVLRVPSGGFSGSFYLPASLILAFYGLLIVVPAAIGRWTQNTDSQLRSARLLHAVCILAVVVTAVSFTVRYRTRYVHEINAPRGTIIAEKVSGPVIEAALQFLESNTSPDEVIAVLPEGNDLAFLSGRRANLRHQVLLPDFLSERDELDAIEALEKVNVRYILVPNRPMREFGAVGFGDDFYLTLGEWIDTNFRVVEVYGSSGSGEPEIGDPGFFIKVYGRR